MNLIQTLQTNYQQLKLNPMKYCLTIFTLLFVTLLCVAQDIKIVSKTTVVMPRQVFGAIDKKTGKNIIPLKYDKLKKLCKDCKEKLLIATKKDKVGVIGYDNIPVIPFEYDYIGPIEGYLTVKKEGKYGIMDFSGKQIVDIKYDRISLLDNNKMVTKSKKGIKKLMDFEGNSIISIEFDFYDSGLFRRDNEKIIIGNDGKKGIYSLSGEEIFPISVDKINIFEYKKIYEVINNNKSGLISYSGKLLVPMEFDRIESSKAKASTNYLVFKNKKAGIIDKDGNEIVASKYDQVNEIHFADKIFFETKLNNAIGMVDDKGKEVVPNKYDSVIPIEAGNQIYFTVKTGGKFGVVDNMGKEIISCKYERITGATNAGKAYFCVKKEDKYALVDANEKIILPYDYQLLKMSSTKSQLIAGKNDLIGIIGFNGNEIIPYKYTSYTMYSDNLRFKKADDTWCTLNNGVETPVKLEDEVFMIVEDQPKFPGGEEEMMKFIYDNIKYPPAAKAKKISGMCVISMVVEKDGSLSNFEIAREIGEGCGEEALRVVKLMPKWTPGKQRGKPVRVSYNLPVRFKLQ